MYSRDTVLKLFTFLTKVSTILETYSIFLKVSTILETIWMLVLEETAKILKFCQLFRTGTNFERISFMIFRGIL